MRGFAPTRMVVGAAVLALVATACGGDGDGGAPPVSGGHFVMYLGEPEHLMPGNTNESEGGQVLDAMYAGLIKYDSDTNEPVPVIQESITTTDNRLFTIKIKPGFTFHNAEPVKAASFVNAWNYAAYGPNAQDNGSFLAPIAGYADLNPADPDGEGPLTAPAPTAQTLSGLKVVDDTTFTVELSEPFKLFPLFLGYTAFYPLADACLADVAACEEAPIGSGPFKLKPGTKWNHQQSIDLVRFEEFKGDKAQADSMQFKIYDDVATAWNDFTAGNVDLMDTMPVEQIANAKATLGDRFISKPTSIYRFIVFPLYHQDPIFQNKSFRQAVSLAIDRQAIATQIFQDQKVPATDVAPSVVAGGGRPDACQYCKLDVAAAQAKLAEAGGWPAGKKLELWFNAGAAHEVWMQAIGDQLKANLGIDYELHGELQFPEYLAKGDAGEFTGLIRLAWSFDYPALENYLTPLYGKGGSSNYSHYDNPAFEALLAQAAASTDDAQSIQLWQQAADMILEDMPNIPLWFDNSNGAHSARTSNVIYDAFARFDLAAVTVTQ